ncbi:MAG: serine protease [Porticoccaceae bacterium]
MIDSILLTTVRINTYFQQQFLTTATSFFFARDNRLFLVTSGHVMQDIATGHEPDRITVELHTNKENLAASTLFSIPLYRNGQPLWRQGQDNAGQIDIAVIEVNQGALPKGVNYATFTPANLINPSEYVEIGSSLLVVGFPLGFHDRLHHLPVVRHAIIASSYGLRFQGEGYFLTDARTHRGTSGSPVVLKHHGNIEGNANVPWILLGIHSARLDVGTRDLSLDEALGLNCVWYADILMTLTSG